MQPDIPAYSGAGQLADATRGKVIRNTYMLLAISMVPTIIGALVGVNINFGFLRASPIMGSLVFLGIAYGLMFAIERNRDSSTGVVLLLGFTFFMGLMLGPLLQVALGLRNGGQLIALAAGGTGATFAVLSAVASNPKRDFSGMGQYLRTAGIVLMVGVVANIFLHLPVVSLVIAAGFVLFASLVIVWQVNALVNGGETNYISATLTLYVAIYNLFTSILRLLMAFTGNRD